MKAQNLARGKSVYYRQTETRYSLLIPVCSPRRKRENKLCVAGDRPRRNSKQRREMGRSLDDATESNDRRPVAVGAGPEVDVVA